MAEICEGRKIGSNTQSREAIAELAAKKRKRSKDSEEQGFGGAGLGFGVEQEATEITEKTEKRLGEDEGNMTADFADGRG